MNEQTKFVDWRLTEVGRQNWEVCHRMLVHDLVDLHIPAVDELLAYYHIEVLPNGAHSAALPRLAYTRPKPLVTIVPKRKKAKR